MLMQKTKRQGKLIIVPLESIKESVAFKKSKVTLYFDSPLVHILLTISNFANSH